MHGDNGFIAAHPGPKDGAENEHKMVDSLVQGVDQDTEHAFGKTASKKCKVAKLDSTGHGTCPQVPHTDMKMDDMDQEIPRDSVVPEVFVHAVESKNAKIGTVRVRDTPASVGDLQGRVSSMEAPIPLDSCAWMDCWFPHHGVSHRGESCVHLRAHADTADQPAPEKKQGSAHVLDFSELEKVARTGSETIQKMRKLNQPQKTGTEK